MSSIQWIHLQWYLRRLLKPLGFWGMLGLSLLLICLCVHLSQIRPLAESVNLLQKRMLLANTQHNQNVSEHIENKQNNDEVAQQFLNALPEETLIPNVLEMINASASAHGLKLKQGEYGFSKVQSPNMASHVVQYVLSLPVQGEYVQIRKWMQDVLVQQHYLALSKIEMERKNLSDLKLDAQLTFILYAQEAFK